MQIWISSQAGFVRFGSAQSPWLYLGWNTSQLAPIPADKVGDEMFGFCLGRLYLGNYSAGGWCCGWLDEHGCLV